LFQVMSALTASVLAESCRQPDELARTAITSERERMRSTTARIFVSGGSMIWTWNPPGFWKCKHIDDKHKKLNVKNHRTSGSGHRGSVSIAASAGFITSMRTSCATLTRRPKLVVPKISKLKTGTLFFFASFITTSVALVCSADAERSAVDSASVGKLSVISLLEWERMR
jgi:hypothetical protein